MIYAAKPQRGGKSIPGNTNNLPQDPPPPPPSPSPPPVPEITLEPIVIPQVVKVSWFRRVVTKIQNIFRKK